MMEEMNNTVAQRRPVEGEKETSQEQKAPKLPPISEAGSVKEQKIQR